MKKITQTLIIITLFINVFVGFSQDLGPGGIGSIESVDNEYMLWMRADKEVESRKYTGVWLGLDEDNEEVTLGTKYKTSWSDQSGNGNKYIAESFVLENVTTPSLILNVLKSDLPLFTSNLGIANGMLGHSFDNPGQYLKDESISGQEADNSHTVIIVWKSNETNPIDGQNVIAAENLFKLNTNNNQFILNAKNGATSTTDYTFGPVSDYTSPTISFISRTSQDKLKIYKNGVLESTQNLSNNDHFGWTGSTRLTFGLDVNGDRGSALNSNIYEVIHTTVDLDNEIAHKILIENYLSAKYDINLGQNNVYKADEYGYDFHVAGIGQDNNANTNISAKGTGIISISNPGDLNSNEYLMWGQNKKEDYSFNVLMDGDIILGKRLENVWGVSSRAENGTTTVDVGTVDVSINLGDLDEVASGSEKFRMMVSSNEDLINSTEYVATIDAGGIATFTEVVLTDSDYFTFEYSIDKEIVYNGTSWFPKKPNMNTPYHNVTVENGFVDLGNGEFKMKSLTLQNTSILVFTDNATISVTNEVNINSAAALYLKDKAQLLQTSEVSNSGSNFYISFITPPKDCYSYSYISSPVSDDNLNYIFADNFRDGRVGDDIINNETSFVFDDNGVDGKQTDTTSVLSTYWMYTYFNDGGWDLKRSTGSVPIGQGITVKETGHSVQKYYAKGMPNNGEYSFAVNQYTYSLLGNPYPSALDAGSFLIDNRNVINAIYFYEDKAGVESHIQREYDGGYGVYTLYAGGIAASSSINLEAFAGHRPERFIPIGQGFMVSTIADGNIVFNNKQRTVIPLGNQSKFFKQQKSLDLTTSQNMSLINSNDESILPSLRIGFEFPLVDGEKYHRQLGLNFKLGNNIETFDDGYDATLFDEKQIDVYFTNKLGDKFVMAGVSGLTEETEIPLYVTLDQPKEVSFMIDEIENINRNIYLYDKELNTTESLNNAEIVKKTLAEGTYNDRFSLVFKENEFLSSNYIDEEKLNIIVDKNQISVSSDEYNIIGLSLINFNGSVIEKSNQDILNYKKLLTGVFILKINTNKGIIIKKIYL